MLRRYIQQYACLQQLTLVLDRLYKQHVKLCSFVSVSCLFYSFPSSLFTLMCNICSIASYTILSFLLYSICVIQLLSSADLCLMITSYFYSYYTSTPCISQYDFIPLRYASYGATFGLGIFGEPLKFLYANLPLF